MYWQEIDPRREADRLRQIEEENTQRPNAAFLMSLSMRPASLAIGQPAPPSLPYSVISSTGQSRMEGIPSGGFVTVTIPRGSNGQTETEVYTSGPVHPALMKDYRAT